MTMRLVVVAVAMLARLWGTGWADSLATSGSPSPADSFDLDSSFVTGADEITDFRWLPDGRVIVAVDPAFRTNRRLYFYYSANGSAPVPGTDADRQRVVVRELSPGGQLGPETEPAAARRPPAPLPPPRIRRAARKGLLDGPRAAATQSLVADLRPAIAGG